MLGPDCKRVVMYMLPALEEQAFLPGQKVTQQHLDRIDKPRVWEAEAGGPHV